VIRSTSPRLGREVLEDVASVQAARLQRFATPDSPPLTPANVEAHYPRRISVTARLTTPFYPIAVDRLNLAKSEITTALAGATWVQRQGPLSNAISRTENARDQIGANVTFTLGSGTLFF
jgi:hypothetical protein